MVSAKVVNIHCNKSVMLSEINSIGFDMDYTLAGYLSPNTEELIFKLCIDYLLKHKGYPQKIDSLVYNSKFAIRGLWYDKKRANVLKVQNSGNILRATHGGKFLTWKKIAQLYPRNIVKLNREVKVMNTFYDLPETDLLSQLVHLFDKDFGVSADFESVNYEGATKTYMSVFEDVQAAMKHVHCGDGAMKAQILLNPNQYVEKETRIGTLLERIRRSGKKCFLLTNSAYAYTKGIMRFLLGNDWSSFFDLVIVDAEKPLWFTGDADFRTVNTQTGETETVPDNIYSGGSCGGLRGLLFDAQSENTKNVLYIGDHIYGDILRSKKTKGWHTFLVVPELNHEGAVWTRNKKLLLEKKRLENALENLYRNAEEDVVPPGVQALCDQIQDVSKAMDQAYGNYGSLFRTGTRKTFFSYQLENYADLYGSSCFHLLDYHPSYHFRAKFKLMPHESPVDQSEADNQQGQVEDQHGQAADGPPFEVPNVSPNQSSSEDEEEQNTDN